MESILKMVRKPVGKSTNRKDIGKKIDLISYRTLLGFSLSYSPDCLASFSQFVQDNLFDLEIISHDMKVLFRLTPRESEALLFCKYFSLEQIYLCHIRGYTSANVSEALGKALDKFNDTSLRDFFSYLRSNKYFVSFEDNFKDWLYSRSCSSWQEKLGGRKHV